MFTVYATSKLSANGAVYLDCTTVINGGLYAFVVDDMATVSDIVDQLSLADMVEFLAGDSPMLLSNVDDIVCGADLELLAE